MAILLIVSEFILSIVAPPRHIRAGTLDSPKAKIYGWAPLPDNHDFIVNPDTGKKSYFVTNSQGWRDVEHNFKKPHGILRILFLGDSNTWRYVPLDDLYTRKTETLLKDKGFNNIEVISIGACGWGTDQLLEALMAEGLKYEPDLVIYQFCDNDIFDNLEPSENSGSNSTGS